MLEVCVVSSQLFGFGRVRFPNIVFTWALFLLKDLGNKSIAVRWYSLDPEGLGLQAQRLFHHTWTLICVEGLWLHIQVLLIYMCSHSRIEGIGHIVCYCTKNIFWKQSVSHSYFLTDVRVVLCPRYQTSIGFPQWLSFLRNVKLETHEQIIHMLAGGLKIQ